MLDQNKKKSAIIVTLLHLTSGQLTLTSLLMSAPASRSIWTMASSPRTQAYMRGVIPCRMRRGRKGEDDIFLHSTKMGSCWMVAEIPPSKKALERDGRDDFSRCLNKVEICLKSERWKGIVGGRWKDVLLCLNLVEKWAFFPLNTSVDSDSNFLLWGTNVDWCTTLLH